MSAISKSTVFNDCLPQALEELIVSFVSFKQQRGVVTAICKRLLAVCNQKTVEKPSFKIAVDRYYVVQNLRKHGRKHDGTRAVEMLIASLGPRVLLSFRAFTSNQAHIALEEIVKKALSASYVAVKSTKMDSITLAVRINPLHNPKPYAWFSLSLIKNRFYAELFQHNRDSTQVESVYLYDRQMGASLESEDRLIYYFTRLVNGDKCPLLNISGGVIFEVPRKTISINRGSTRIRMPERYNTLLQECDTVQPKAKRQKLA